MYLFGFSLSFCIKSVLQGEVWEEDVAGILTSTALLSPQDAMAGYYSRYWKDIKNLRLSKGTLLLNEEDVTPIVTRLWPRIIQPRLLDPSSQGHNISQCLSWPWYKASNVVEAMEHYCEHRRLREAVFTSREQEARDRLSAWENQYWNKTLHSRLKNNVY